MIAVNKPSQHSIPSPCLGVVLAGGLSTRMGKNKAALTRNNTDMLSFSQQLLLDAGIENNVISGNFNESYANTHGDVPVCKDLLKNAGPLGGIHSIIERYSPQALLILPVDLPLMDAQTLKQLKTTGELSKKACFYQQHYLPLYLPVNAYVELFFKRAFANFNPEQDKGPSIRALLKQTPHQALTANNPNALFNTNTPEQWQQVQSQAFNPRKNYV